MKKDVFVRIENRSKKISFESCDGPDDVGRLRKAFQETSKVDADLKIRLEHRVVFFQTEITTKKGTTVLCDLEEDQPVEDESQLVATFCSNPISALEEALTNSNVSHVEELQSYMDSCTTSSSAGGFVGAVVPSLDIFGYDAGSSEALPDTVIVDLPDPADAGLPEAVPEVVQKKAKRGTRKLKAPNVVWKELDLNILKLRPAFDLFYRSVVKFYSEYLCAEFGLYNLNGSHYDDMGALLCAKFPELGDSSSISRPQASISSDISQCIRNKRRREKVLQERSGLLEKGEATKRQAVPEILCNANSRLERGPAVTDLEQQRMEKMREELKEKIELRCTSHIRMLFKSTHVYRRSWICHELPAGYHIKALSEKWPDLVKPEMILLEQSLMIQKETEALEESLLSCLLEVAKFCELELPAEATHRQILHCLCSLYVKFKPRNASKNLPPCLTVKEARTAIGQELNSLEGEGPRCVLYLEDDTVASCFLVADHSVRTKLTEPNPTKAVLLILAAYRVWDKCFPSGYKTYLNIFEEYGLGLPVSDVTGEFKRFQKSFKLWREKQSK